MPNITIDGVECPFQPGQTILQVANANNIEIPQYCYHDALSIVASCRICLAEVHAPNPRNDNKLEPIPKLLPTCQTSAGDGQVVYTQSPRSQQNQKAVMEALLINHPLDCPVCDQSGECHLQDYSYKYGRGVSRFEEAKVKQPKKDVGPNVLLYADRCIMCSRCVRFTREVTGTSELLVTGRGNHEQIDVFPGHPLDNDLSANVIDLCPVGALLDKDFLFAQRVWFLKSAPSIDGITSSGDNILIEHNEGKIYRIKPRTNMEVNKWWITDEVRFGWKFVHSENRLRSPMRRQHGLLVESTYTRAYDDLADAMRRAADANKRVALIVSPMVSCEDAYSLAKAVLAADENALLAVGPTPISGEDKVYPVGASADDPNAFIVRAEKAPNRRGVERVLAAMTANQTLSHTDILNKTRNGDIAALIVVGGYTSDWATDDLRSALAAGDHFVALIDTLGSPLVDSCDVVLPGATWAEKAGTFENCANRLQAFEQAIDVIQMAKPEAQIGIDLLHTLNNTSGRAPIYNAANIRHEMAQHNPAQFNVFTSDVHMPIVETMTVSDMEVVEL